jgi:proteasome accessory factor B
MDKTERLLDLVALLLAAKGPLALAQIRAAFPDEYSGNLDSAERKFERDKAELLELGIPLTFSQGTDDDPPGYVLDREAYYLPEPGLEADELAVLYAAGSAALESGAFPGQNDLAHALRKIGFFSEGPVPAPKVRVDVAKGPGAQQLAERLEALWGAINARKTVTLEYYSPHQDDVTLRAVNPFGLALRRGVWNLVGHCHLRGALRTFQVHRVRALKVNPLKPRSPDFEVPADFVLDAFVASWPWQHRIHAPLTVVVALTGALKALAPSLFGEAPTTEHGAALHVTLQVTDLDGLARYVLSQGTEARLISPPEAVDRARALATAVLQAHGGAP